MKKYLEKLVCRVCVDGPAGRLVRAVVHAGDGGEDEDQQARAHKAEDHQQRPAEQDRAALRMTLDKVGSREAPDELRAVFKGPGRWRGAALSQRVSDVDSVGFAPAPTSTGNTCDKVATLVRAPSLQNVVSLDMRGSLRSE